MTPAASRYGNIPRIDGDAGREHDARTRRFEGETIYVSRRSCNSFAEQIATAASRLVGSLNSTCRKQRADTRCETTRTAGVAHPGGWLARLDAGRNQSPIWTKINSYLFVTCNPDCYRLQLSADKTNGKDATNVNAALSKSTVRCKMPSQNATRTPAHYASLEASRSPEAIELETVNHHLTLWFMAHPECASEIAEFKAAQRYLETISGDDDELDTFLKLTLALDWFRSLFGHRYSEEVQ